MSEKKTIAFFGLGEIGAPIAGRLVTAGHRLLVRNRSKEKQQVWLSKFAARPLHDLQEVATADVVISCLGSDADLRELYLGKNGLVANLPPSALIVDHTTASARVAREIGKSVASYSGDFLDAPVSGGSAGAENGVLSVMVGGPSDAVRRATPVFRAYSRSINHIGELGTGQLCKMVNQICIAGVLQGLAEGLAFARASDLDIDKVLGAISGGAAASWQMENRSSFMLSDSYEAGFAARLMYKDLDLCQHEAARLGLELPGARLALEQYADLIGTGFGDEDFSNLHRLVRSRGTA